jgi:hypothetical protein
MKSPALPLALIAFMTGCADSSTLEPEQPEALSTATQGLGELGCATMSVGGTPTQGAVISQPSWFCAFSNTATSPDASYGTSECPSQFVTEVRNVAGRAFNFTVSTPGPISDSTTCNKLRLTLGAYGRRASGWSSLGTVVLRGSWYSSGGFSYCQFVQESGGISPVTGSEGFDVVRAAGSAYTLESLKGEPYNSYRQVTVGIYGGRPC